MCFKVQTAIVLFCTTALIDQVLGQGPSPQRVFVDDENNHTWTTTNFPEPYPQESKTLLVTVAPGYSISVIITSFDIDSEKGDFLVIKAGTTLDDENTGKVFAYKLKDVKKYIIDSSNVIMHFKVLGNNDVKKGGFSLNYKREGVAFTTETSVNDITWPTPADTDHVYFTGNVSGRNQNDFNNDTVLNDFKSAVAQMAIEYCIAKNITFKDNITEQNVHIKNLIGCPYEWPESSTCVKVRFALPIYLNESTSATRYTKYELTSQNLDLMWDLYADKYLPQYSMSVYQEPNTTSKILLWLGISLLVIIIFIAIVFVARHWSLYISPVYNKKRRSSDTQGIVANEIRRSTMSLSPHMLQVTPPFFEVDGSYTQHEPVVKESTGQYDYLGDDESDNEITISTFSYNRDESST